MSHRSSKGRRSDEQVRLLKAISARIVEGGTVDAASWNQLELTGSPDSTLQCVLNQRPYNSAARLQWIFSSIAGQAVLECMQAIIQHGPAALHAAISASVRDEAQISAISLAVSSVVSFILTDHDLLQAWPTGVNCCMQTMREVTKQLPLKDFNADITASLKRCIKHLRNIRTSAPLSHNLEVDLCIAMLKGITSCVSAWLRTQSSLTLIKAFYLNWVSGLFYLKDLLDKNKASSNSATDITRIPGTSGYQDDAVKRSRAPNEWQCAVPFLVKSFHLALEIIKGYPITDPDFMDKMFSLLDMNIKTLSAIESSSPWLIQCVLETAKLVSDQCDKRRQWESSENKDALTCPLINKYGFGFLYDVNWITMNVSVFGEKLSHMPHVHRHIQSSCI